MDAITILAAGSIPDHQVAMIISDALGALGGAFAGDNIRPISRWNKLNRNSLILNIKSEDIDEEKLTRAFASFSGLITNDEIRNQLLGR